MTHLKVIEYGIDDLTPYHKNPRKSDLDEIMLSLKTKGQYRPIVVNLGNETGRANEILAGNHTWAAAKKLGWTTIEATTVDVDADKAAQIVLADNRLADLGEYDDNALADLLSSVSSLDGTGYTADNLSDLLQDQENQNLTQLTDPDDVPETQEEPLTKEGQIWKLGGNTLLVGSSTDTEKVKTAFNGTLADCTWTDPPYGVSYVGKTKDSLTIKNDGQAAALDVAAGAFETITAVQKPGTAVYVAHADSLRPKFQEILENTGMKYRETLIWVKNSLVMGHSDYQWRHEPIMYAMTPGGEGTLGRGGRNWYGGNNETTVLEVNRPTRNKVHPTMKPVELIQAMIKNSTPPGGLVFDPFAGSGSTLIAAYDLGMNAIVVELDPIYADVICRRFQEHTGIMPELDGKKMDFILKD